MTTAQLSQGWRTWAIRHWGPKRLARLLTNLAKSYRDGSKRQLVSWGIRERRALLAFGWDCFARSVGQKWQLIFRPLSDGELDRPRGSRLWLSNAFAAIACPSISFLPMAPMHNVPTVCNGPRTVRTVSGMKRTMGMLKLFTGSSLSHLWTRAADGVWVPVADLDQYNAGAFSR